MSLEIKVKIETVSKERCEVAPMETRTEKYNSCLPHPFSTHKKQTSLYGFNSRLGMTEERVSKTEDKSIKVIQSEERKRRLKNNRVSWIMNNHKRHNICITGVPEGKEKVSKPQQVYKEMMAETLIDSRS